MTVTNRFMNTVKELQNTLETELNWSVLNPCIEYIGESDSSGIRIRFNNNSSITLDRGVKTKDFYSGLFNHGFYGIEFSFEGKGAQETLHGFKEKLKEVKHKISILDGKWNQSIAKQANRLLQNDSVRMETRQELELTIDILKDKLKEAQNKLENLDKYELENLDKNQRWKPDNGNAYWFVTDSCKIDWDYFSLDSDIDRERYNRYNCFHTQEEARKEANKILIRRTLEDLARRLNSNGKIDWDNQNQRKYFINYYCNIINKEGLRIDWHKCMQAQGIIYCLDENFIKEAIKEIGEQNLISYIKGE